MRICIELQKDLEYRIVGSNSHVEVKRGSFES